MKCFRALSSLMCGLLLLAACGSDDEPKEPEAPGESPVLAASTVLDVEDVKTNPADYEWFDFRPNVKKLILAGAAETEHVAILWYTVTDGMVGLHYHAKTESVYVIEGTQTDAQGVYPTGTVYFNPPGSGHAISDSSGFFILAYASPPDFASTDQIGEYTPVRIDTTAADLTTTHTFEEVASGVDVYAPPLDEMGGMRAQLIQSTTSEPYTFEGNYLLVLDGACAIEGKRFAKNALVVAKDITPQSYSIAADDEETCFAMGVSF